MKRNIFLIVFALFCLFSNTKAQVRTEFWFALPNITQYHYSLKTLLVYP